MIDTPQNFSLGVATDADTSLADTAVLAESLRQGQNALLEMIAKGAALKDILARLMLLIESQSTGVFCSVLLLDEDGLHIHPGAGPSLPEAYMQLLDGLEIGPGAGSCGTATYRKEMMIVSDILVDPLWAPYKEAIIPYGFRACWSTPIFLSKDLVLGTFAMYYRDVRIPHAEDMRLIGVATHLAGIAIERTRREQELDTHRNHLKELVAARTAELELAKERAELSNLALIKVNQELASAMHKLSLTQVELVRRDKLAALGSLVAGLAHELNTPIGTGLTVASTLAQQTQIFSDAYALGLKRSMLEAYIADAGQASAILVRNLQRAASLVNNFKQIAVDQTASQRSSFSLPNFIKAVVGTIAPSLKKRAISLNCEIQDGLKMDSYTGPLGQVLQILLNNCLVHAFEGRSGGNITITGSAHNLSGVDITIQDDGVGIPETNLKRIYDPFFTTKLGTGGSGLGLYIVHNFVCGILGGKIKVVSVVSEPGGPASGTRFIMTLPLLAPCG